jgi:hypothetical protein
MTLPYAYTALRKQRGATVGVISPLGAVAADSIAICKAALSCAYRPLRPDINLTHADNRINRSGFHFSAVEFGLAQISGARRLFDRIPETTDRRMKEH